MIGAAHRRGKRIKPSVCRQPVSLFVDHEVNLGGHTVFRISGLHRPWLFLKNVKSRSVSQRLACALDAAVNRFVEALRRSCCDLGHPRDRHRILFGSGRSPRFHDAGLWAISLTVMPTRRLRRPFGSSLFAWRNSRRRRQARHPFLHHIQFPTLPCK